MGLSQDAKGILIYSFKFYDNVAQPLFTEIFNKHNVNYELSHISHFSFPNIRSIYIGMQSLSFLGPKIWDIMPKRLKEVTHLSPFKL